MIVLYDQNIDAHYPPHYKTVYEDVVAERGGKIFCYAGRTRSRDLASFYDCVTGTRNTLVARLKIAFRFAANALRHRKQFSKETVLVHDDVILAFTAYVASRLGRARFVYRISQIKPEVRQMMSGGIIHRVAGIVARIRNVLMKRADAIILMSEEMRLFFEALGISHPQTEVIPSCIDVSLYEKANVPDGPEFTDLQKRLADFDLVVVYVGNLNQARGTAVLAPIMAELNRTLKAALLCIGAQSHQLALLRQAFDALNLSNSLVITASIAEENLAPFIRLGHVGLSIFPPDTAFKVNSPLKTLNYIASGVPFVGTDTRDQRHISKQSKFGLISGFSSAEFSKSIISATEYKSNADIAMRWLHEERDISVAKRKLNGVIINIGTHR